MSDDGPNYSRNIVQRRQLVSLVFVSAIVCVSASVWRCVGVAVENGWLTLPNEWGLFTGFVSLFVAALVAAPSAVLAAYFAGQLHRTFCPESPDEQ